MKGDLENFEEFHLGYLLVAIQISGLHEKFHLFGGGTAIFLQSHGIIEVAFDFGNAQVAILVLIVFLEDHVDSLADFLVTANHDIII
jgi:hypothetical protein